MKEKDIKKQLLLARRYREHGQPDQALPILHQIVEDSPNITYLYLLAATYYECGNDDQAIAYADIVLEKDSQNKEALQLKGVIYENQGELVHAEDMYLKALEVDPYFFEVKKNLVYMYFKKEKRYEDVIIQCEPIFSKYSLDKLEKLDKKTDKKLLGEFNLWTTTFTYPLYASFINLHKYEDAIRILKMRRPTVRYIYGDEEYTLYGEDQILFKLYYLLEYEGNTSDMRTLWKNYYKASDSYISGMEKDVKQGYILKMNDDNYTIAEDGTYL